MKIFFIAAILITGFFTTAIAQNDIPLARQAFHDRIDKAQLSLESADRTADGQFTPYPDNASLNKASNTAATDGVDNLQKYIEKQSWDNNTKLKYLRGLLELLEAYRSSFIVRGITGAQLVNALKAYKEAMDMDKRGDDIAPVISKYKYEVAVLISRNYAFQNNAGKDNFNNILVRKNLDEHPSQALGILNGLLRTNPDFPATDSIIHAVAKDSSDAIYTYAQSYTPLGERIRKSSDPLVSTISKIANAQGASGSKTGRYYMPFLDALYKGDITMDQIDDAMNSDVKYFKLLVKTEIQYVSEESNGDTAMALGIMKTKLHDEAVNKFINTVNGLHEKPNDIRYACLNGLSPTELYYLIVVSETEIYTSTYYNGKDYGIYNMIWQKGGKELTGDKLMMDVHFDYYRKWIKMAANYNTLDNYLGRMEPDNAHILMRSFVRNLDKTSSTKEDSLEGAVDVAGSYSSIDNPEMKQLVLDEVQSNLQIAQNQHNQKAYNIYYILNTLFLSMDTTNKIDVSERLGIEPVYFLPIDKLKDTSGRIIIQQFTYGDLDGKTNYANFIDMFSRFGWKVSTNKFWANVSSTKGTPITIYTNRPLDEHADPSDEDAQNALNDYLDENDIHPTLAFHRGHSYWLPMSIKQLQPTEKLVFLGSCGGFQSLNSILGKSPGAQIISTKQTGVGDLNLSMIRDIILTLQKGQNLNWVKMWHGFNKQLSNDTRFADYVPPYENLGAVFLVAYQKLQDKEKEKADSKDITVNKSTNE